MISKLIAALQSELEMSAEEIADTLWLALHIDFVSGQSSIEPDVDISDEISPGDTHKLEDPFPQKTTPSSSTDIHMNTRYSGSDSISHLTGLPFRIPAASALPNTLSLARALRSFMRRILSKTTFIFNENATVQIIAEAQNNIWFPILDPAPIRWFDVALVIDEGASMMLWKDTIAELRTLLEHLGAFRDVRVWRLATDNRKSVQLYTETDFAKEQSFAHNPKELIDPSGRRLILVVTDCVSLAWHSGGVQQLLDVWGKKNLVTLIQMLPHRLWHQTALDVATTVRIDTSLQEISNAGIKPLQPFQWFDEGPSFETSFPIPVVTLEPRSLLSWSRIVTGSGETWITGKVFEKNFDEDLDNHPPIQEELLLSAHKRVQLFHANASQIARRLAGLLAAAPVPISLQVIRLIRQTMLPQAGQVHIAEVLLSGLLEEIYRDEAVTNPGYVEYDFIAGVRDELLNAVPIPDGQNVLREISTFIGQRYGQTRDFPALITTQEKSDQGVMVTSESRPFAQITVTVLRRFGGKFASLAENLEQQIKQLDAQTTDNQINTKPTRTTLEPSQTYSHMASEKPIASHKAFLSKTWCDFNWTEWIPFDSNDIKTLPTSSGVYRVRAVGGNELFYIGHTGRNLRERVGDLIRNTMRDPLQMPFNDPHTAAPSLWAWRDATEINFECSACSLTNTLSDEEREAVIHYLLWQYRLELGKSTLCNYGRIHPYYVKSGNRSTGHRGYRLPEWQLNNTESPDFPPLRLVAMVHEKTWMGLAWSDLYLLDTTTDRQNVTSASGAYKILDADTKQLLFIGYSTNLRTTFQTQARKNWLCPHPSFAFSVFSNGLHSHQVAEIESDLIGGYYAQVKTAPKFQFKNRSSTNENMSSESRSRPVRIFLVFDRKDQRFRDDMITQLAVLRRNGKIDDWHEYGGYPGSDWQSIDNERLNQADLILLFITPDFIASDYCYSVQMQQALARHKVGKAHVIPILFRPTLWRDLPFAHLQGLPLTEQKEIKAVSEWRDKNEAYVTIIAGIQDAIEELSPPDPSSASSKASEEPPPNKSSPARGTRHFIYNGHSAYLIDVAWSPDGKYIASGGGDSTIRVWNAKTGNTLYTYRIQKGIPLTSLFSETWSIAWSPDSKRLAFAGKKAPQIWEPGIDLEIATYHGHSSFLPIIANMAWSPDGQFIASTNIGSVKDQALHIWFSENGLQSAKFDVSSGLTDTSPVGGVAWSSDSRRIACGLHGEIRIYDVRTKRHLQTYINRSTYAYYSVCWTSDGKRLVCSDPKQAVVWDVIMGNTLYTYNDHAADIRDLALSPNGKYVASASNDRTVHIWETETGKRVFKYEGHKDEVAAVTWSPDGTQIASACKDGTIHVWQAI